MAAMPESKVLGKKMKYSEQEQEYNTELLPKLPNDITVQLICTKLSWRTFHVLSSVSRAWLGAIRSGEIHDTRIRSGTAETLAFLECDFPDTHGSHYALAVYSLRDEEIFRLPTLPPFKDRTYPLRCGCVAMGGKIYIVGALMPDVWVLDVARQKKWQRCASMRSLRSNFECGVFEGKIYVFGASATRRTGCRGPIEFSEVYDPKVDAWTTIKSTKSWNSNHKAWAGAVGNEILVDGGKIYHDEKHSRRNKRSKDGMEAYNPAKDSWRTILPGDFGKHEFRKVGSGKREKLFTAHGRLHSLSGEKISVIDLDKKSVKVLHECSFTARFKNKYPRGPFWPDGVLVTNDGLLTKGHFDCCPPPRNKCRLFRSGPIIELGIGKKEILLEELKFVPLVTFFSLSCLEPIQL